MLNDFWSAAAAPREQPLTPVELAARIVDRRIHLKIFLDGLDPAGYLSRHGISVDEIEHLRRRMIVGGCKSENRYSRVTPTCS